MANLEIVNEYPLSMQELKEKLDQIKKRDKDLNPRGIKTYDYITRFLKKDSKKLKDSLNKLGILRLKDKHINKIIDIFPKNIDELKAILSGENLTLKQEDLTKIVETMKNA
jgi:DNA-directed RNA polymerase subunit F